MLKDVTFGQYYPADSIIHKMDSRAKIIFIVAYIVAVFLANNYWGFIALTLFVSLMVIASCVPLRSVLRSLKAVLFLVLFTIILNLLFYRTGTFVWENFHVITWEGIDFSLKMALRLILLVVGTSMITLTTTPMSLTDGIEWLLSPLKVIKFPVHDIAIIMSIALRLIPSLVEEISKIMAAQKARGASFDTGGLIKRAKALLPVLIPLFVSSFNKAGDLALALDARCYNATDKRTKMKKLTFTWRDLVGLIVVAGFVTLIVFTRSHFLGLLPPLSFL